MLHMILQGLMQFSLTNAQEKAIWRTQMVFVLNSLYIMIELDIARQIANTHYHNEKIPLLVQ